MRVLMAGLFCLALVGCKDDNKESGDPARTVTEMDNGKDVTIKKDGVLQVKLAAPKEPETFWGCRKAPPEAEFLTEGKEGDFFEFNFKIKGNCTLLLECVKFGENGVEKKGEFKVNLKTE